jgi:peptidyl-prolyl cis-trans isomerase C
MAFAAATVSGGSVRADAPDEAIVARVGSQTVTAGELSRRISSIPPFQLKTFGKTEDEIKRNFLERVIVRDLLLAQGAVDQKLDQQENVEERVRATMRSAMVQTIRIESAGAPITDAEVAQFYKDNADKFHAPVRIALWRILVATKEDAVKIIEEMKKDGSVKHWNDLARERSQDKSTNLRGGNLGYVDPEGKTADVAIVVDKAIVEAAASLKDGEPAAAPVKEGEKWAVVWRRQTMAAVDRSLDSEAAGIRQTLARQRAEAKLKELIDHATGERVRDVNLELVDDVTVSAQGDLQPARRPGLLPARRLAPGQPAPHDHR